MEVSDFIVVGSGATGSMAAQTLIERGARVLMLDAGLRDDHYDALIPSKTFAEIRATCEEQYRFFIGDRFESVPLETVGTGAQLTPPRQVIVRDVDRFLAVESKNFFPMESLAYGGLGAGWGLGCCVFSEPELQSAGLDASEMRGAYQTIASRIGISGAQDDAIKHTHDGLRGIQPASALDPTCERIRDAYDRKRDRALRRGFRLGRPALALLTQDMNGRGATQLRDMEFYDDRELAAWRPWITVEQLKRSPLFAYRDSLLVTRFEEREGLVTVHALDMRTLEARTFVCRRLILASGTLGTARIALRSGVAGASRLPLLCNPYNYLATIVPSRIGGAAAERKNAVGQLVLFHDPSGKDEDIALGALYTYRSLLSFRLARQMPLAMPDALSLLKYIEPALVVVGIHHPDRFSPRKNVRRIVADGPTGDALSIEYELDEAETRRITWREREYVGMLRALGAMTLRSVSPGHGASIHYAGTLPFSETERAGALHPTGRLHGFANVHVADGSGFRYLPAKSLTLSLMANAHLVARRLA